MDDNGLGMSTKRKYAKSSTNGNAVETFREHAKAHYEQQRNGDNPFKKSWTPERRAAQAERMRKRMRNAKTNPFKGRKTKTARPTKKTFSTASGKGWARRWYERLEQHGPERIGETAKAFNTSSSSLLSSSGPFLKGGVIKKGKDKGVYMVGATAPPAN
jgi:hypothetical protein